MTSQSAAPIPHRRRLRISASAAAYDLLAVLVFVIIGRINHDDGVSVAGVFSTLWPFAVGAALGWSVGYLTAHLRSGDSPHPDFAPSRLIPEGLIIWVSTVVIGMIMRDQFGQGIAVSFIVVATVVLGLFLLGWRSVRSVRSRRAAA